MRIVIVEDEIRIREGIISLLKRMDGSHEIVGTAVNGHEGLSLVEEKRPDLIITDIKLPVMSGLEMLEALSGKKISCKAIILSAFSEFEFARQAIGLGVSEYLVKPISLELFTKAVNTVQKQIRDEMFQESENPQQLRSLENILYGLAYGSITGNREITEYLINNYDIRINSRFLIFCIYHCDDSVMEQSREYATSLLERGKVAYICLAYPEKHGIIFFLYNTPESEERVMVFTKNILPLLQKRMNDSCLISWSIFHTLNDFRSSVEDLWKSLDWGISFPSGTILEKHRLNQRVQEEILYPMDLEVRGKGIICAGDGKSLRENLREAYGHFTAECYHPADIRKNMIRYLTSLYATLSHTGAAPHLALNGLIEKISSAKTGYELEETFHMIGDSLIDDDSPSIHSLPVRRIEKIIEEQYNRGISLFEIAEKLNLTPGYLGSLFHRETGQSFNNFLKQYRIQKAKILLLQTNDKLLTIARTVGFSDSKYFSKTFRELTGMLPLEYRRTNR